MAVSKPVKDKTGSRIAKVDSSDFNGLYRAAIFTVDDDGTINTDENNGAGVFLLNPSTWEESKSSNWAQHSVPGQSDPIFQWVNSGARVVTFTALCTLETSDMVDSVAKAKAKVNPLLTAIPFVGAIAASFFNVAAPAPRIDATQTPSPAALDISDTLDFYRSLLYPVYDTSPSVMPNKLKSSPPLCVLFAGNSLTNVAFDTKISTDTDVWVVTNLRIKILKQLPNLFPLEAEVEFQLTQYTIKSFDRNRFTF